MTETRDDGLNVSAINLRILAAASAFASKDEGRYYLTGVHLEIEERATTYVATDGHTMITYREERSHDEPSNLLIGKFIIPTAHCKAHKLKKKDDGAARIFGHGRLTIAYEMVDVTFMPIDGTFPEWRRVLPKEPPTGSLAQFNLTLLARFHKFANELSLNLPFVAHNGVDPAPVWFSGEPNAFGVIMPVRCPDQLTRNFPAWALRGEEAKAEQPERVLEPA